MDAARPDDSRSSPATHDSFGALLRHHRLAAGLTQEVLAERAGMSAQGLRALESGRRRGPYRETVQRLIEALALTGQERERFLAAGAPVPRRREGGVGDRSALLPERAAYPGTLPRPPTALIGREREVQEVRALLGRDDVRLVTLTGSGGVGKTRLAIQVATSLREQFSDGVVFASLAPVRDPRLLLSAIAQAVGVVESGELPLAVSLRTFLRGRHLLLVADNCEHLLEAAPELGALLEDCPALRLLTTSRAALRLSGEWLSPLDSLALPPSGELPALPELGQVAAIRLFVERARGVQPDSALSEANAGAVAAICARLDGLPLAIELAAARVFALPPAALLALLQQPLRLLTGGKRDAPARHRTLRDTIAWSYELLTPVEQATFRRLSVCAGGVTLKAAEALCREETDNTATAEDTNLMEVLIALVDLHLLWVDNVTTDASEPRFRMLETIREFGREQLEATGESEAVRARHAAYYLTWTEHDAMSHTFGDEQFVWLERLEAELGNLRVALGWCEERGQAGDARAVDHGMVVAGKLFHFWYLRAHLGEGRAWLGRLLALPSSVIPTRGRGIALNAACVLAGLTGERAQMHALGDESLAILRVLGEPDDVTPALIGIGACRIFWPRPGTADLIDGHACLEEAVAFVHSWDRHDATGRVAMMQSHTYLAESFLFRGELASARAHLDLALAVERAEELHFAMSQALQFRGIVAQAEQDLVGARIYLERQLVHAAAIRALSEMGYALMYLGDIAQQTGDRTEARSRYLQALRHFQPLGYVENGMHALAGLAEVLLAAGEPFPAARLVGAASALTAAAGAVIRPEVQARLDRVRAATAAVLGAEEQEAAWAAGQETTLAQVIAEELAHAEPAVQVED